MQPGTARLIQSIGLNFFERHGHPYLILMDHFSELPMFQKMRKTPAEEVIVQLKSWFSLFGVSRLFRLNNRPPFSTAAIKDFCNSYIIGLNLKAPYHPERLGAAKRGVGLVKAITKKTKDNSANFKEAFAAFKNTRDKSGYSPNQRFFFRNWHNPMLPDLVEELSVEDMVKARDKVRSDRVNPEQETRALPKLVLGQEPQPPGKTGKWNMAGTVVSTTHGERLVFSKFNKSRSRMFNRADVKLDTTGEKAYDKAEEEGLKEATKEMVLPKIKYFTKGWELWLFEGATRRQEREDPRGAMRSGKYFVPCSI